MKNTILAALICTSSFAVPAFAQDAPKAEEKAAVIQKSSREIATAALDDVLAIFKAATSADSVENAKKAAAQITAISDKFAAYEKALDGAKAPSQEDKVALAVKGVDLEEQMMPLMQKMMVTMMGANEEVKEIMEPVMDAFTEKSAGFMEKLTNLYPREEMQKLADAEKEKRAAAKEEKAEETK